MGRPIRARLLARGAEKKSSLPSTARLCVRLRRRGGRGGGDKDCAQGSQRGVRKVELIVEIWFETGKRSYVLDVISFCDKKYVFLSNLERMNPQYRI